MSADPSVAYPCYVQDRALKEPWLQTLANFVHMTLAREPDPKKACSHFLLLLSSLWSDAFPTNPKNEEAKPSVNKLPDLLGKNKSKEHKKRKLADDNILHNMNQERMRMVASYTTDQRGKDVQDEDVVRPVNLRWSKHGGEETQRWKLKSRARCPTYCSCQHCKKS